MFGLVRFAVDTPFGPVERLGALIAGDRIVDLRTAYKAHLVAAEDDPQAAGIAAVRIPDDLIAFIRGGVRSMQAAKAAVAFAADTPTLTFDRARVRLLAPLTPGKMVGLGRNYMEHARESSLGATEDFPRGFVKVSSTLVAPDADIPYPTSTKQFDYEVELAVVIGKPGRNIAPEAAMAHVFGYTIFNDLSARDWQMEERKAGNHLLGKNLDGLGPLGPSVIPSEFLPDPMNLRLCLRVNGETRQDARTSDMIYDIAHTIAHWSHMTLEPGDLLATGTPAGVAMGRKPPDPAAYLKRGDVVEAEVEGIGVLRNRIV
jgi:acylpyruvate hydrolase